MPHREEGKQIPLLVVSVSSVKSDSKSPAKTKGGHSLRRLRAEAIVSAVTSENNWAGKEASAAEEYWGVHAVFPARVPSEIIYRDVFSPAVFLSQVQGKRKIIVSKQIEL